MNVKARSSTKLFLILLGLYIFFQFIWWANLLIRYNPASKLMVIGEGSVFLTLLGWGIYRIYKAVQHEISLAKVQKNFLLSVTHELKTPVAAIKLFLQTLVKRDFDLEKRKEILEKTLGENERLSDLIDNVLLATSLDNKELPIFQKEHNCSELIASICNKFSDSIGSKHQWELRIEQGLIQVIDQQALLSMVQNLLSNAVKYSPVGSKIEVTFLRQKGSHYFEVKDQGVGVAKGEEKKIFDKFYRIGNEETRSSKGTGLGLYIVRNLALLNNAQVNYQANSGKGSTFSITFLNIKSA